MAKIKKGMKGAASKKGKKSNETPEEVAARLEMERLQAQEEALAR